MVYCGKASQGCQSCRTRRIKVLRLHFYSLSSVIIESIFAPAHDTELTIPSVTS